MSDFALTNADRQSPLWRKLKQHLETEVANLREKNDSIQQTEIQTAALRGRILALKDLLALDRAPEGDA